MLIYLYILQLQVEIASLAYPSLLIVLSVLPAAKYITMTVLVQHFHMASYVTNVLSLIWLTNSYV